MVHIASNQYYELSVNQEKNRMYLKVMGTWEDFEEPEEYITDMSRTVQLLNPGFTVLTDAREMGTCSHEIESIHLKAIKISQNAGLAEAAEVISNDRFVVLQNDYLMKKMKVPYHFFDNISDADKWLDEIILLNKKGGDILH